VETLSTTIKNFDEKTILHDLKHYLPSQTPIKDFIHHNTLHAFQDMKFYDAIFKASAIFGYQPTLQLAEFRKLLKTGRINNSVLERIIIETKGIDQLDFWKANLISKSYNTSKYPRIGQIRSEWKKQYKIDIDNLVQPILFRVLCNYLDQGVAINQFPELKPGFLTSLRELDKNSFVSIFKTKKVKKLFHDENCSITNLLHILVGNEAYFTQYLFDQQFSHQGWSGIVSAIEDAPGTLLDQRIISLRELIIFELLLEIDAVENELHNNWEPLTNKINFQPLNLFTDLQATEITEVLTMWQNAFEWTYYDEVLNGIAIEKNKTHSSQEKKSFQAMFCIDERECSLRRHIETIDLNCETFGTPGFFSAEFYFQPQNGKFYEKLCPAPVNPKYLILEHNSRHQRKHELLYNEQSNSFLTGILYSTFLGIWSGLKLFLDVFRPKMNPAISDAFAHMQNDSELTIENTDPGNIQNNLQVGFTVEEMAVRAESLLRSIDLTSAFAPLVYVIAHGSSSANNPHHSAHDCGACSGRPGSVNARVFAFMANHKKVRELLRVKGILIPEETQFVGGLHDTAADQISFYDEKHLSEKNKELHKLNKSQFEKALDLNTKERSRRFASINTKMSLEKTRKAILNRSVSMFEPRPELGHGTNTLCIVGSRDLTKGLFLDRRAFLNSYNYKTDPTGEILTGIMKPLGPVCGGINLEYYFSRVDNLKLGAGTKLPHNVMGLIGVANSCDGDLRPGLPVQMIEVHDPVRLLLIVEHFPDVVLKTIKSVPEMYEWYKNEWIHLMVIHPETSKFHYFKNDSFSEYKPLIFQIQEMKDIEQLAENAKEMETNNIVDATKENLPVYLRN